MWTAILAVLGAVFQIALLIAKEWIESKTEKKEEIRELKDEFKEAIKDRDYGRMDLLWLRARRLREK